jgi:transcriptional regulator GlxA family with amidase domain
MLGIRAFAIRRAVAGGCAVLVAIFAPPDAHSLALAGPLDVFAEANQQLSVPGSYEIAVVAIDRNPVLCASGLRVLPDRTVADPDAGIDTLMVAGPRGLPGHDPDPAVVAWLRRSAPRVRRYGAVCTGTFLLGAAGLLDGRRATTHWRYAAALAAAYPAAVVEPDRIFVRDGPMFTSAGVAAGIDLALALVEEDHGPALARAVARELVMFLNRPGGQSHYGAQIAAQIAGRSTIQNVLAWIVENPSGEATVASLAARAGMSERNFARVFSRETGMTPADFVQATRIDTARRLLEETALPLKRISLLSGFADAGSLRRAFVRRQGTLPLDYRRRFRSDGKA